MTAQGTKRPARLFKGWWLLLLIVGALAVYTVVTFGAGSFLDKDLDRAESEPALAEAREWRAAWNDFGYAPAADADAALTAAEEATERSDWPEAARLAREARQLYMDAFEAEAAILFNEVLGPWRDKLLPRFPFNPQSSEDAPLDLLARLCNPDDGRFFRGAERIERLSRVQIRGLRVAPPPADFAGVRALAQRLRDGLFEGGSQPYLEFAVQLTGDIAITVGHIEGKGGEFTTFRWEGEGASLMTLGSELDASESPWGPWRVLWHILANEDTRGMITLAVEKQPSPLEQAFFQP